MEITLQHILRKMTQVKVGSTTSLSSIKLLDEMEEKEEETQHEEEYEERR